MTKRKFTMVKKRISQLDQGEITTPRRSGRYRGVSIGKDKDGYFVTTHRARSKSYPKATQIPKRQLKFIESTG